MNWKQLICMWCGIAAICGLGWPGLYVEHFAYMGYKGFFFRAFFVALVTGGLIVTFRDKKATKPKDEQKTISKSGQSRGMGPRTKLRQGPILCGASRINSL